ncbi:MAG TPA: hypothetical protein DIC52_20700, partial [Candidatus Latescibacteria bacterium]|nr:hypothetical protein [Candidatus Latescibacterota bacterium]
TPVPEPVAGNIFIDNTMAIDNRSGALLVAQGNYWGTSDSTAIAGLFAGEVDFSPYLDAEGDPLTAVLATQSLPASFALHQAWPNPFNATTVIATVIAFDLPLMSLVELTVYDVLGRRLRDLAPPSPLAAGRYEVRWDARDDDGRSVASGVYFYRLRAGASVATGRVVLAR